MDGLALPILRRSGVQGRTRPYISNGLDLIEHFPFVLIDLPQPTARFVLLARKQSQRLARVVKEEFLCGDGLSGDVHSLLF